MVDNCPLTYFFPSSWEEGKVLFSREDFFKDLEFFNMKAISDKTFIDKKTTLEVQCLFQKE